MTETEVMELIKEKREGLEQRRSEGTVSSSLLKVLEDEIKELESSLNQTETTEPQVDQAFLDECAG